MPELRWLNRYSTQNSAQARNSPVHHRALKFSAARAMLLCKFWLPDLTTQAPHMWGQFSEALPHAQNSAELIYSSPIPNISSTVVENQPWSLNLFWAAKTAKKAFCRLYQMLLLTRISYIIHTSAIFCLAYSLPKVRTWGKGEHNQNISQHPEPYS